MCLIIAALFQKPLRVPAARVFAGIPFPQRNATQHNTTHRETDPLAGFLIGLAVATSLFVWGICGVLLAEGWAVS